jgi:hypothetical protein
MTMAEAAAAGTETERATKGAARTKAQLGNKLSDSQFGEVMRLAKKVDAIELKLTIPDSSHRSTIQGLEIDPVESEPRQVFFFDTPDLKLNAAGLVVRARRMPGGIADTVVKLRPVDPKDLPDELRRSGAFKVELDVVPGGYVCSGSLKGRSTGEEIRDAVHGRKALRKVFSREQREFFGKHAPRGVTLESLMPLGPTFTLRSRFNVKSIDRKATAEYWLYPDGTRILELSTKAEPGEAYDVAAGFIGYLRRRGVDTSGAQQTKTKIALDYYSAALRDAKKNGGGGRKRR